MARVYIGIGSNIGERALNCRKAVERMGGISGVTLVRVSSFYETDPWGVTGQRAFINAVAELETDIDPHALLAHLKSIESEMGRVAAEKWGPRVLDLDILFYNGLVISGDELSIPHRLVHQRAFMLVPLSELSPELVHPLLGKTVAELLRETGSAGVRPYTSQRGDA